jgi:phage repressor protein C with HTH and peptisase S24 domain/DNA-binding XRE family transcriptional regulator
MQEEINTNVIFSERLRTLMKSRSITQTELADALGLAQSAISNYLKGRIPKSDILFRLAVYFGVTANSLVATAPSPEISVDPGDYNEWKARAKISEKQLQDIAAGKVDVTVPRYFGGPYYGTQKVAPIISWASAGESHSWEDMGMDVPHIPTACRDPNTYALQIDGDSMAPLYRTGDVIVVSPNIEARQGDLIVAKTTKDEVFFKELHFSKDMRIIRLFSLNPNYPALEFKRSEIRFLHPIYSITRFLRGLP